MGLAQGNRTSSNGEAKEIIPMRWSGTCGRVLGSMISANKIALVAFLAPWEAAWNGPREHPISGVSIYRTGLGGIDSLWIKYHRL